MKHFSEHELIDYFYRESDASKTERISFHLQVCNRCRQFIAELESTGGQLDLLPSQPPPEDAFSTILAKIEKLEPHKTRVNQVASAWPYALLAALIAVVTAAVYFLHGNIMLLNELPIFQRFDLLRILGEQGMTIMLCFILGSIVTLVFVPVLILDDIKTSREKSDGNAGFRNSFTLQSIKFLVSTTQ